MLIKYYCSFKENETVHAKLMHVEPCKEVTNGDYKTAIKLELKKGELTYTVSIFNERQAQDILFSMARAAGDIDWLTAKADAGEEVDENAYFVSKIGTEFDVTYLVYEYEKKTATFKIDPITRQRKEIPAGKATAHEFCFDNVATYKKFYEDLGKGKNWK